MAEIEFGEEQAMLQSSASDFLNKHSSYEKVRERLATESGHDAALWRELGALGWLGVALPEQHGGAGLPVGALVALAEPMGRYLFASPFLATTLAGQLLLRAGNDAQQAAWLPKLASGEAVGTVALTEPTGSWELGAPELRAEKNGEGGYTLTGSKLLVLDAGVADIVIVSACLGGQPALFAAERAALPATVLRREQLIDEARRAYRLDLDGLTLTAGARLDGGDAAAALEHVSHVGALLVAAEMVGGTEGVMGLTLDYLQTREQFGRLIGSYQALKHPMVDILIAHEQARSLLHHAATVFEGDAVQAEVAVRMAKAAAGDSFTEASDRAIQFHGGIGFTYECHAQLYFRRAQWGQYSFGDAGHHRRRLEPLLLGDAAALDALPVGGIPGG
ncbi:MAG: acyl-CoA dehydrogenase [Myxococcales bacterium]|nr:acyl-CoA dehydrogenase [Myxococcales bacterium]